MPEIKHTELNAYLKNLKKNTIAPVYLIYGEEFLYKKAFEELLNILVPPPKRNLNYEPIDGTDGNVFDCIEHLNTFSFMSGRKVVALCDSRIFYSKLDKGKLLEKAKAAYDNNELKKAGKSIVNLLSLLNLSLQDIEKENRSENLKLDPAKYSDAKWLDQVIRYCKENNLTVPAGIDHAKALQNTLEKGFPKKNHLIITTDTIDKRRGLFKCIKKEGMVINCAVPMGNRFADKKEQESVLSERMHAILSKSGKKMNPMAFKAIYDMTGFDVRTFSSNLEKLVTYIGEREKISVDDVTAILKKTKQDPIYELTGAISDKDTQGALFYVASLLSDGINPLQILAAMINQVRKILAYKGFTESRYGKSWRAGIDYRQFQSTVMPAILEYDKNFLDQINEWDNLISENNNPTAKTRKKKPDTDLVLAKNPGSPYPVFQIWKASEKFTREELLSALESLSDADLRMKTTGQDARRILEKVILGICKTVNG